MVAANVFGGGNSARQPVRKIRSSKSWSAFRNEYERRVLKRLAWNTQLQARASLDHFERIVRPAYVSTLSDRHVRRFVAVRRKAPGRTPGQPLSPGSVNKDLRHVKAALGMAKAWGYLAEVPTFRMEKGPEAGRRLPRSRRRNQRQAIGRGNPE